jgi:hypothetical protein
MLMNAPKLFAIAQDEDDTVVAWGMAFPERVEVVSLDGTFHCTAETPESALRLFTLGEAPGRVVWAAA